jgi:ABC-type transport system substrate-binding protein
VSDDGRTITFKLNEGKWSDGRPLTAADGEFTINTIVKFQKDATALEAQNVVNVTKAEALDDHMLVVHYSEPTASALTILERPADPSPSTSGRR